MPSPFPGMDPYLESELWTSFHFALANAIVHQLVPKLRPRYLALGDEYFMADFPDHVIFAPREIEPEVVPPTIISPLELATVISRHVPHARIDIRDVKKRRRVTTIEILSPTSKGSGRLKYLARRDTILRSSTHLIEIDLLRQGLVSQW